MSERVEVRFARRADEAEIRRFLRDHWRRDHIFVEHPELLLWQHAAVDAEERDLTFVLATKTGDDQGEEILGLLGFMPFRRFDASADWTELALAIWKVREDTGLPGLGLQLLRTIKRDLRPALICAIGTSEMVRPIYTALGYTTGALSQVALFPAVASSSSSVALGVPEAARLPVRAHADVALHKLEHAHSPTPFTALEIDGVAGKNLPRKSWTYIVNRYLEHPFYTYQVRAVSVAGLPVAVFVWRKVDSPHGSVLRMVDIVGDADVIAFCGTHLRHEIENSGCEYMDLLHWGVSPEALAAGGFIALERHSQMILPNYFEPFERCNVKIHLAFWADPEFAARKVRLFRADSDQDRPNRPGSLKLKRGTA